MFLLKSSEMLEPSTFKDNSIRRLEQTAVNVEVQKGTYDHTK